MWYTPDWPAPSNIVAFQTTRDGGQSHGRYDSFNVGLHVDDNPTDVEANRAALPFSERITWLNQIHSDLCVDLPQSQAVSADAAISRSSQHFCAVMTADCVPVLLTNKAGTEVAAIHAGWQGLVKGIIANTLARLASDVNETLAWIGPCISQQAYEVGDDVASQLASFESCIVPASSPNKYLVDLPAIAKKQLQALGVPHVFGGCECTYQKADKYFSHRRAQHQGAVPTGRMVSVIGIK